MASKEERLARRVEKRLVQSTMEAFSGPLPPPAMLAQYNDVVPNGAERIMAMAERQQETVTKSKTVLFVGTSSINASDLFWDS